MKISKNENFNSQERAYDDAYHIYEVARTIELRYLAYKKCVTLQNFGFLRPEHFLMVFPLKSVQISRISENFKF